MLKRFYFSAALLWTAIITFLSLVQFNDLPFKSVSSIDKIVHVFFHFVFTSLWFLYFEQTINNKKYSKPLLVSMVFSLFFGIFIEILQEFFTISRHADLFDVFANMTGLTLAATLIFCFHKFKIKF